jgi:uncharacterized protein YegP (UPF0339 family)
MITVTILNPVCSIHGTAYHNGHYPLCDELEGITTIRNYEPQQAAEKESDMKTLKVKIFKGKDGKWYFRGRAGNNEIVLPSQHYSRRSSAVRGFKKLQQLIANAEIVK